MVGPKYAEDFGNFMFLDAQKMFKMVKVTQKDRTKVQKLVAEV